MESPTLIIIIGGGIGGLTAALALLQRGLDVAVYEQAPELKEIGAGIQIGSNGTRVLYALGLEADLQRTQVLPSRRQLRHWRTGETWNWFDLGSASVERFGTPHILMHRNDLHGVLAEAVRALKPDAIKLGMRCTAVAQSADAVTVQFANGEEVTGAFAIGADGIHSQVRKSLFGADAPEFTGCVAWRGLVADGSPAAASVATAHHQLARSAWPRAALSGAPRRADEFHQHRRARRLAGQILDRGGHAGTNWPAISATGTPTCTLSSATLVRRTNGRCSPAGRCRAGRAAASRCSATPAIRPCRFSAKAR